MKNVPKYKIEFIDKKAVKEYKRLDGSVKKFVDIALSKLSYRADEIGKPLERELSGCKEIKFRKDGIRIIFRIVNGQVEIVEIISIGSREDEAVFKEALKRLVKNT
ncbi:hypothetical protein J7E55_27570 [Bacillus sp. ISL-53]|nr:hypothetical protein [Bacillus sp. ISL-53]